MTRRIPLLLSSSIGIVLIVVLAYLVDYGDSLTVDHDNSLAMSHPNLLLLIVAVSTTAMTFLMFTLYFMKRTR